MATVEDRENPVLFKGGKMVQLLKQGTGRDVQKTCSVVLSDEFVVLDTAAVIVKAQGLHHQIKNCYPLREQSNSVSCKQAVGSYPGCSLSKKKQNKSAYNFLVFKNTSFSTYHFNFVL